MTVARPILLLLLALIPLWLWWRHRRPPPALRIADGHVARRAARASWIAHLPVAARSLALAALIVAAAGPGSPAIEPR